jgi:hypothetical protein
MREVLGSIFHHHKKKEEMETFKVTVYLNLNYINILPYLLQMKSIFSKSVKVANVTLQLQLLHMLF